MGSNDYSGLTLADKYHLTTLLGQGGMGAVYRGEHVVIGKKVAVKFLHADLAGNEEVVKRFYREAQAAAAIGHDSIIDVMDVGVSPNGEPYLVMEYLEGESLGDMLARTGPIDLSAALGVMEPALRALAAAHAKGIVHRDLKPDNIFVVRQSSGPPKIKLIDFGISKFAEGGGEKLTQTGSVMGTPAYMAPEQARGASALDHRADLYSMGVILYEMLTQKLPFAGGNFTELIINILTNDPIPPAQAYPGFPAEATGIVMRALAKNPADRFESAEAMIAELAVLTAYSGRQERLTRIAADARKTTFAGGSLGEKPSSASGTDVAKNVLSQVAHARTPAGWTGTATKPKGANRALVIVVAIAAAITVGGGITAAVLWSGSAGTGTPQLAAAIPAQPPAAPTSVSITVKGAPADALVFFDDVLVTVNPFRVKAAPASATMRVQAPGFEPFIAVVTPNADQEIVVSMQAKK
ncbi:MAG: serine/threonine protein kinase [Proteobacteria bacterium]|jgi:serine/threonine-protein kinase|nr:serine/threonine protein kinase [Pseudomonadota bacterium]